MFRLEMRSLAAALVLTLVAPLPRLGAQRAAQRAAPGDTAAVACHSSRSNENRPAERRLWNGYRVATRYLDGDDCAVTLYTPAGDSTLAFVGFNTTVEAETGTDLDNDGAADLLLMVDEGGGNRCCAMYHAISFVGTPHVTWTLGPQAIEILRGAEGTVLRVWHAFYDLGPSMADAPVVAQVFRPSSTGLADVTVHHCDELLRPDRAAARDAWNVLTPERRQSLRASGPVQGDFELLESQAAAYTILLQLAMCGRVDEADRFIATTWPDRLHATVRATVLQSITRISAEAGGRLLRRRDTRR